MPEEYTIPASLMQALHDYLTARPMREVESLVGALRQCKPVVPPVVEDAKTAKAAKG